MKDMKIEKIIAKDGSPILKINDYYIHSKYNPIREAEKFVDMHYRPHNLHIVFGYGSGYFIEELLKIQKFNEKIIVIDPLLDSGEIIACQEHAEVLNVKISDIPLLERILTKIDSDTRTNFNVFCTNNYEKLFPEEYKQLLQQIRDIQETNRVNDNTLLLFAEKWQENLTMNLRYMEKDANLAELYKKFEHPVVIASSGPSLQKQLPLLQQFRQNVILISSGSTTNVLLKNNIKPDFIVTIDGGEPNYNHFKDLNIDDSIMIYSFQNHYKIRKSFKKQAFVCNLMGHNHVSKYINDFLECELPELLAGSTVANLSFSIAQYISTGPIAFIGQDLAYTDNLSHVQGHNHTKNISGDFLKNKNMVTVEGYFGDKVVTSASMNSMRLEFEKMPLIIPPANKFFNCTEGGAKIKGFEQSTFLEFLENFVGDVEKPFNILSLNQGEDYEYISNKINIEKNFKQELKRANNLIDLYKEAIKVINKDSSLKQFKPSTLKKLDKLDIKISNILNELPLDHILVPTVMAVKRGYLEKVNETVFQKFNRVKLQNITLYQSSLEAVRKFCIYIEEVLKIEEV